MYWNEPTEPCPTYDALWQEILDLGAELDALYRDFQTARGLAVAGWLAFAMAVAALMIAL